MEKKETYTNEEVWNMVETTVNRYIANIAYREAKEKGLGKNIIDSLRQNITTQYNANYKKTPYKFIEEFDKVYEALNFHAGD